MFQLLSKFKIHTKLLAGFAILLCILLLASSLIRLKLIEVENEIGTVLNAYRPIEQLSLQLDAQLDDTFAALGIFVSVHDEASAATFRKNLDNTYRITDKLQHSEVLAEDVQYVESLADIRRHIDELRDYGEQVLQTSDDEINFPGLAYANNFLNPIAQEIQQLLTQLVHEDEVHNSQGDHDLLLLKAGLRYSWVNVMSSVRAYLAYRSDAAIRSYRLFREAVGNTLQKIESGQYELDLDDEATLQQLTAALIRYEGAWAELQTIHTSELWRTDSYLMRTRIAPLFDKIEDKLETFTEAQQAKMDRISDQLLVHSNQITNLADMFLFLGLFVGVGMATVISRVIAKPIRKIALAMEHIASGEADLTRRLDASGRDELAGLAKSFNTFALKAQHRAEEEKALSSLLRLSLEPTNLDSYLNDALKLVIENVAWLALKLKGGIFIVDPDHDSQLKLTSTFNFPPSLMNRCATVAYGQCLCGVAAQSHEIVFADHLGGQHDSPGEEIHSHAHYSVPIRSGETLLGVLVLYLPFGHERSINEEAFLYKVAEVFSMGIRLRQANTELLVAKQRAESYNEQLTSITENIPGIIYQCCRTSEGACTYPFISPGTASLLGRSGSDQETDAAELFSNVHQQDKERLEQTLATAFSELHPINIEYRLNQQGGGIRWILCNAQPRQTPGGQTLWDGILLDITDRKSLESKLLQAQKLESVGQLASGIAHEINTPTQYVQDNTRFLMDAFEDYAKALTAYRRLRERLNDMDIPSSWLEPVDETSAEVDIDYLNEETPQAIAQSLDGLGRINSIVSAMKEFSHPGIDSPLPIDINKVIENIATVSRNEWKYVAELDMDLASNLPSPLGYRDKLGQVILNLIVNAAHAIADNVKAGKFDKGQIRITSQSQQGQIEVRVSDNGPGIPYSIQEKIFDPFFTTKGIGKGTGQGLSIAHSVIVEVHQGNLLVESVPGEGATFIIQLPIKIKSPNIPAEA